MFNLTQILIGIVMIVLIASYLRVFYTYYSATRVYTQIR